MPTPDIKHKCNSLSLIRKLVVHCFIFGSQLAGQQNSHFKLYRFFQRSIQKKKKTNYILYSSIKLILILLFMTRDILPCSSMSKKREAAAKKIKHESSSRQAIRSLVFKLQILGSRLFHRIIASWIKALIHELDAIIILS